LPSSAGIHEWLRNLLLMAKRRSSRWAWGVVAILAVVLLGGIGRIFLQLWPYPRFGPYNLWIASNRGRNADLPDACLRDASLPRADLREANLCFADLRGADLVAAHLAGAHLRHTNFRGARLRNADLRTTDLIGADLRGADVRGVDMTGAKLYLTAADLTRMPPGVFPLPEPTWSVLKVAGARYDAHTRWPADFNPRRHGAILR
jgi:hypothetical protein